MEEKRKQKVVFCVPTITKPYKVTLDSLAASIPLIQAAGYDEGMVSEVGCPYISAARATMLRKALDAKADIVVFIDHDLSWRPEDMLKLIQTEGEVVGATYRFKTDEEEKYMGSVICDRNGYPIVRPSDGAIRTDGIPAGFLKVHRSAVNLFMKTFPHLCYGEESNPHVDLFNHGAYNRIWWGEDMAFCRNWTEGCGQNLWLIPDVNVDHWLGDKCFPGNYHQFLMRQPGADKNPANPNNISFRTNQ